MTGFQNDARCRCAGLAWVALVGLPATGAMGQLPTGGHSDCATFLIADGVPVLTIDQHVPDCVINWDSFNIGEGYTVGFLQGSSSWRVLNRVTGAEFSTIAGTLLAPGTVYIVNPAGIYFTGGAVVDVGGIYAAAGSMSDTDFLAGVDRFTGLQGEVVNEGSLFGTVVHMVGRSVINDGTITVDGAVTMIAGENEVLISETGGRIMIRVDGTNLDRDLAVSPPGTVPPTLTGPAGVENSGTINASGGQVVLGAGDLFSLAIRNTGTINASGGSAQLAALGGTVIHGGSGNTITTGDLAMTGDVLFIDGDINAQTARFNDPVIIGSDVTIMADTEFEADSIVFASTVDSQAGEINDLRVESASTEFAGNVGSADRLGDLQVTGDAVVGGDVRAIANVTFGGQVALNGDTGQTIDTGGILQVAGAVSKTGSGDLILRAVTLLELQDDVSVTSATGRLTLTGALIDIEGDVSSANERVVFNGVTDVGGTVSAALDTRFNGDATVGADVSAGRDALFFGLATVGGSVIAGDDVRFSAAAVVGADVTALGDDVLFVATAHVGGSVTAFDDVEFFGDAVVGGDVTAQGLDPTGGDVTFFGTADVGGTVTAEDDVEFLGTAVVHGDVIAQNDDVTFFGAAEVHGSVTAADDVDFRQAALVQGNVTAIGDDVFFRAGAEVGGNVQAGDKAQFDGDAVVDGDVTTSGGDVLFMAGAEVGGSVVAGDDVKFSAAASVAGDVTALGDDVQFFSTAHVGGNVTAFDDVRFDGDATVGGTVTSITDDVTFLGAADLAGDVIAADDLSFGGVTTLTGTGVTAGAGSDQRLEAGGVLTVSGTLTKTTNGSLTLVGRELMNLNGTLVSATDDILLNPDGSSGVPVTATIAAAGSLSIVSQAGSIVMGPNEKMTALGDLHLEAARSVTAGDLNSVGDMHVTAPEIFLRTRAPGLVLNFGGVLEPDKGLDFVTGGRFFFSVAPQAIGGGPAPAFGSPNADADALGTLGGFRSKLQFDLGLSIFTLGETILDLQADGISPVNLAEALTGRQPGPGGRPVEEDILLSPGQAARLARLGINVRPLRAGEQRSVLSGRYFYNDAFASSGRSLTDGRVAINRLSWSALVTASRRFDQLFLDVEHPDVPSVLALAWGNYAAGTDEPDGVGFRRYVESAANRAEALGYLDALQEILDLVRISGLSATELAASTRVILDRATPAAIGRDHLRQAIQG